MDLSFLQTVLASGLGFLGSKYAEGLINQKFKNISSLDERRNADLLEFEKLVHEVRDLALAYWRKDNVDPERHDEEAAITGRMFFLGRLVEGIFVDDTARKWEADLALNKLDEAISGGDFQVSDRKASPRQLAKIQKASYETLYRIRTLRRELKSKSVFIDIRRRSS